MLEMTARGECVLIWGVHTFGNGGFTGGSRKGGSQGVHERGGFTGGSRKGGFTGGFTKRGVHVNPVNPPPLATGLMAYANQRSYRML